MDAELQGAAVNLDSLTLQITILECSSPELDAEPFKKGFVCSDAGQEQKARAWAALSNRGALKGMTLGFSNRTMQVGGWLGARVPRLVGCMQAAVSDI